jgi:hypothetical protein
MEIPEYLIEEFVGKVDNYYSTNCCNVYGNRFRLDLWTKTPNGNLVDTVAIKNSWFVALENDKIVDLTREAKCGQTLK